MSRVELHQGDALAVLRGLPAASVHCCVTSPPYFGLRDYNIPPTLWGDGWVGCLGLEPTPAQYVERLVEVFAEVRRVLRDDGTLFLNLGDSYYGSSQSGGTNSKEGSAKRRGRMYKRDASAASARHGAPPYGSSCKELHGALGTAWLNHTTLKPKDLIGIPWMVAFALRADGWYLRSDIVWAKPNPMPESVTDRPTKAHEYLFLLAKSPRYYYDAEAIKEPGVWAGQNRTSTEPVERTMPGAPPHRGLRAKDVRDKQRGHGRRHAGFNERWDHATKREQCAEPRNRRSVWTIPTFAFPEAHFATFPPALVEPCIKAGTSERGCCASCGAPWGRVVDVEYDNPGNRSTNGPRSTDRRRHETAGYAVRLERRAATVGWRPACSCPGLDGDHPGSACADEDNWPTKPCTVLDPFGGAGTTAVVACRLGRDSILIDLNSDYVAMQERRIVDDAPLFNAVTVVAEQAGGQATIFDAAEVAG